MKIAGIIAEYNPFHNGHALHMKRTRELTGTTHIICVISGNFVQRGEPAIADKWMRANMALLGGADMVIELPFLYAAQSAEGFAAGGVRLLDSLNCVDFLSFGSECADLELLDEQAGLLAREPGELTVRIKELLGGGISYPKARGMAVGEYLGGGKPEASTPNDILAVEYLKAIHQYRVGLKPVLVERKGSGYHDGALQADFSSASAIRSAVALHGTSDDVLCNIPKPCHPLWNEFIPLTDMSLYFRMLLYRIYSMDVKEIADIWDVEEGLEYRIKECAKDTHSLDDLVLKIKSKRYTYSRIKRILLYLLTGTTKELVREANKAVPYARVLGFRKDAGELLRELSRRSRIPIMVRTSDFTPNKVLEHDFYVTNLYSLLHKKNAPAGRDFSQPVLKI